MYVEMCYLPGPSDPTCYWDSWSCPRSLAQVPWCPSTRLWQFPDQVHSICSMRVCVTHLDLEHQISDTSVPGAGHLFDSIDVYLDPGRRAPDCGKSRTRSVASVRLASHHKSGPCAPDLWQYLNQVHSIHIAFPVILRLSSCLSSCLDSFLAVPVIFRPF